MARAGLNHFAGACSSDDTECENNKLAYGLYGGYQFTDWFALETGLTDYGKAKAQYPDGHVSFASKGAEFSAKFSLPLAQDWAGYSRIGGAYQSIDKAGYGTKQSDDELKALVAFGVDYQLSRDWSLRGEYQYIANVGSSAMQHADLNFASIGVTYHFGKAEHHAPLLLPPLTKLLP